MLSEIFWFPHWHSRGFLLQCELSLQYGIKNFLIHQKISDSVSENFWFHAHKNLNKYFHSYLWLWRAIIHIGNSRRLLHFLPTHWNFRTISNNLSTRSITDFLFRLGVLLFPVFDFSNFELRWYAILVLLLNFCSHWLGFFGAGIANRRWSVRGMYGDRVELVRASTPSC